MAMVPLPRTITYRTRVNADAFMLEAHTTWDVLLGQLVDLEAKHGMFRALLPGGRLAHLRKTWSYGGVLTDGRDIGNWYYAVVMRTLFHMGVISYDEMSDEKLGDVVEALLYLGYEFAKRDPLDAYAVRLNNACLWLEHIEAWARGLGYWETSREMAELLL